MSQQMTCDTIWCKNPICEWEAVVVVLRPYDPLPLCAQCHQAFEMGQANQESPAMPVEDFLGELPHMYSGDDLEAVREMIGLEETANGTQ